MTASGFAFAAAAAVGNSCIDGSRKFASQRFTTTELIGLVGLLDAVILGVLVFGSGKYGPVNAIFAGTDLNFLRIVVVSAGIKVIAGFLYQRALHLSPLSVTVPYLAFTPVLLVFTSFFMMHEMPSYQGLLGVVVVTIGGYLLAIEQPAETEMKRDESKLKNWGSYITAQIMTLKLPGSITWGREKTFKLGNHVKREEEDNELQCKEPKLISSESEGSLQMLMDRYFTGHIFEPLLALKREQGSLLMLGVASLLSISNSLDKMGAHLAPSPIVFAAIQKIIMAIPVVLFLALNSPLSFKHLFGQIHVLSLISIFEVLAFICYLKSLETLLVAYAIAAKRSNVLITVFIGRLIFKEKILRRLPFILLMVGGMALIIFA